MEESDYETWKEGRSCYMCFFLMLTPKPGAFPSWDTNL